MYSIKSQDNVSDGSIKAHNTLLPIYQRGNCDDDSLWGYSPHGSVISEVVVRWPDHDDCQTDQSPSRELGISHSKPLGNKGEGRGQDQARRRRRRIGQEQQSARMMK